MCDLESSTNRQSRPTLGLWATKKIIKFFVCRAFFLKSVLKTGVHSAKNLKRAEKNLFLMPLRRNLSEGLHDSYLRLELVYILFYPCKMLKRMGIK